jgi:hypothetical protein
MASQSTPRIRVFDSFPQELVIEARGPDVALFVSGSVVGDADPETFPDPVELFLAAVNEQMFPGPVGKGCTCRATLIDRSVDRADGAGAWRLRLEGVHPGCLRVLANLLAARELDAASIHGASADTRARPLDPMSVLYPPARSTLAFVVEREDAIRAFRDRLVQIEFVSPPPDDVVDRLFDTLDVWTKVMLLGGYPPEDMEPRESGVFPDGPILLDERTVQHAFPEAFQCDESAFNCVVNHVHCLGDDAPRVALVRIR